jgi:hypothetical protein
MLAPANKIDKYLVMAALGSVFLLAASVSAFKVRNFDLPWHFKTGEWIFENGRVPQVDFFSFTQEGREWIDVHWFFQALVYCTYKVVGEAGFTWLMMTCFLGTLALLFLSVPARGPPSGLRVLCGLAFVIGFNSRIICRPEMLTCLCMAAMICILERARWGKPWLLGAVPLVQLIWVNSQGLWAIGPAIVGAFVADQVIENWRSGERSWRRLVPAAEVGVLVACVLVGLIQPYGVRGFLFPLTLFQEVATTTTLHKQIIVEFQPLWSVPQITLGMKLFLVPVASSTLIVLLAGPKSRPFLVLLAVFFIYLAAVARRNISIASVVLLHVSLVHLDLLLDKWPGQAFSKALGRTAAALALAGSLALAALTLSQDPRSWDDSHRRPGFGVSWEHYPRLASRFLHSIKYEGLIINNFGIGGYLIYEGWPQWKVMADGRILHGNESLALWERVHVDMEAVKSLADQRQVEAVVLTLWNDPLQAFADRLMRDEQWALVHVDSGPSSVVFLRRIPKWQAVIDKHEIWW